MKAYVLHNIGDFHLESVAEPVPAEGEVIVQVKAVGICGSDIPRIYQNGAYSHPLIPGHEFSGIVTELGNGVDPAWLGRHVGVFPLVPCGECGPCVNKQYEMCRSYGYLGSRRDGAFAEYVAVPEWNLMELPDGVSFEVAAMLEPMAVAVHAMRRVAPQCDETVVVCGLGTIGLLLLMFLREAGIEDVLLVGNKDFQRRKIIEMGIAEECYCDSRQQDAGQWIMEKTGGKGTDVFFECVGRNETVAQAVSNTAPAGRVMLVGNPHSDMKLEKADYWKILRNQLALIGTWNSSYTREKEDDWYYVIDRLEQGKMNPSQIISHRYSLDDFEKGFEIMRDKKEDYIKVMAVL